MSSCTARLRTWTLPPGMTPPLPEIARHVQLAFQRAGYGVRVVEATSLRYARLVLRLPGSGDELEMDLLKEALEPRWVTVQITDAESVRQCRLRTPRVIQGLRMLCEIYCILRRATIK